MAKPNCTTRSNKLQRVSSTATFVERAKCVHGERFDYRKVEYENTLTKVCIICPKHGEFWQKPKKHLAGQGCRNCSFPNQKSIHVFIREAREVHKNLYSYNKSNYINGDTKIVITCKKHGDFLQKPVNHLRGNGCKECYRERAGSCRRLTKDEFVARADKRHKGFYSYEKAIYKRSYLKVVITCPEHGDFKQSPTEHINKGSGCPKCRPKGWHRSGFVAACKNNSGLGRLYIIKCFSDNEVFYKIGITSQELKDRFSGDSRMPYEYKVLFDISERPSYVYDIETKLHRMLKGCKYMPSMTFSGQTECFTTIKPIEKLVKELQSTEQLQLLA